MKARLFFATLLLVSLFAGCNKDESLDYNKLIIGEWRMVHHQITNEEGETTLEEFFDEKEEYHMDGSLMKTDCGMT